MRMRASWLLPIAMFMNFFGWFIVRFYVDMTGLAVYTPFQAAGYYFSSLLELVIIFIFCLSVYFFVLVPRAERRDKRAKSTVQDVYFPKGSMYYAILLVICCASIWQVLTINFSFDTSTRGVGQFDRDFFTAVARLELFLLPAFIFFRLTYASFKSCRVSSAVFMSSYILNSLSYADRRMMMYFLIAYFFIISREVFLEDKQPGSSRNRRFKQLPFLLFLLGIMFVSYYWRVITSGSIDLLAVGYVLLQGGVGSLGASGILLEVKSIVDNQTGFLLGESFLTYFSTALIPSIVFYLFGSDEFFFRSAYEFNRIFNYNLNMGYDFMVVADFYWNFGYIGYLIYLVFAVSVLSFVSKYERSGQVLESGLAILMAIFFVAGLRSDFGFFLKGVIFCSAFYFVLFLLAEKRRVVREPTPTV